MKKFFALLLTASLAALAPMAAQAADMVVIPQPGQPPMMAAPAANNSGIYVRGDVGASWLNWSGATQPWTWVGDAGIGYQLDQNWRGDVTYNMSGTYGANGGSALSTTMVLGNVYYDFANASAFTPYIGAGAGYGWEWGSPPGATNASGIAVAVNAGLAYSINRNLAVDLGYRFHDILDGQQTPEHQVAAGLRVKF